MSEKIVTVNFGTSSLKYQVFLRKSLEQIFEGTVTEIGREGCKVSYKRPGSKSAEDDCKGVEDTGKALQMMLEQSQKKYGVDPKDIVAVAHRVVHGGHFTKPVSITKSTLHQLEELDSFAPLHNPPSIAGIRESMKSHTYGIPASEKLRRYGMHGLSFQYICRTVSKHLNKPLNTLRLIIFHLGSGSSACAIENGVSIDTSMGLTPTEGVVIELVKRRKDAKSVEEELNKKSGLLALCGTADMREIEERANSDEKCKLALNVFCYRVKKYLGSYLAVLGGKIDAIVFTGGIGEHSSKVRELSCSNLTELGIDIDSEKNNACDASKGPCELQSSASKIRILCVKTDEGWEMAHQTKELLSKDEAHA